MHNIISFIDPCDDSNSSGERMEEGLNGMVVWPNYIPRGFQVVGRGSRGDIWPARWNVPSGSRFSFTLALLHRWASVPQKAPSASAPTPNSSDESTEDESECSTTADDLTTIATVSSVDSGSEAGTMSEEPIAVGKRHLVSL